jgi:hypothetical protein
VRKTLREAENYDGSVTSETDFYEKVDEVRGREQFIRANDGNGSVSSGVESGLTRRQVGSRASQLGELVGPASRSRRNQSITADIPLRGTPGGLAGR